MRLIPRKLFLTRGVGVHKEKLTSFEMALREARIAHFNLVRVSSIFPPSCKIVSADEGLPLTARLAIQAMFQGDIDYLAFNTPQTPADVQAFYTAERMGSAGWQSDELGCIGEGVEGMDMTGMGAVCYFTKQEGDKNWVLAIIAAPHEGTNNTDVFFARIDISQLSLIHISEPTRPY